MSEPDIPRRGARPTEEVLIEQLATALSNCSEMLNGWDQAMNMVMFAEAYRAEKSPLTKEVDAAVEAWRRWNFG